MTHMLVEDTIEDAIRHLRNVLHSTHCRNMSKSTIVGYLGELLVWQILCREKRRVVPRGNQSAVDLEYEISGGKIGIDVKTSTLKQEFLKKRDDFLHWGWAMRQKAQNRSLTHFVCVGLDEAFNVAEVFVIRNDVLCRLLIKEEHRLSQFKKVSHGLLLPRDDSFDIGMVGEQRGALHMEECRKLLRNRTVLRLQKGDGGGLSALLERAP